MGLYIAALIASAIALCALAFLLGWKRQSRWPLALAFLVALPLQPLAFVFVRIPVDALLHRLLGASTVMTVIALLYASLTEEPAKWLTAAVPAVRRAIAGRPVAVALATGLGFGIGEIWFLAYALTSSPNFIDLPFYMFWGFIFERLEVCFLHGALVLLPFLQLARGRPFWLGALAGMTLHFALNFPIYLAQIDAFGLSQPVWQLSLLLWVIGFVGAGIVLACQVAREFDAAEQEG